MNPTTAKAPAPSTPDQVRCEVRFDAVDMKVIVAEIDAIAAELAVCYAELPPKAKVAAINLAHELSQLRSKFTL